MHIPPQLKAGFPAGLAGLIIATLACGYGPAAMAASSKIEMTLATTANSTLNEAYMIEFRRRMTDLQITDPTKVKFGVAVVESNYDNAMEFARHYTNTDGLMVLTPTASFGYYTAHLTQDTPPTKTATLSLQAEDSFDSKSKEFPGFTIIGRFVTGPETYVTKKPLKALIDLKGLKFRVEPSMKMVSLDAFNAFAIPYVFNKQVAINDSTRYDGAIMPIPEHVSGFWKTHTPNLVFNNAAYTSTSVMVRTDWFNNLCDDAENTLRDVVKEMDKWANELSLVGIRKAADKWVEIGGSVSFIHLPAEQEQIDQINYLPSDDYTKSAFGDLYRSILKDVPAGKAN